MVNYMIFKVTLSAELLVTAEAGIWRFGLATLSIRAQDAVDAE